MDGNIELRYYFLFYFVRYGETYVQKSGFVIWFDFVTLSA